MRINHLPMVQDSVQPTCDKLYIKINFTHRPITNKNFPAHPGILLHHLDGSVCFSKRVSLCRWKGNKSLDSSDLIVHI